jgi:AraC family L-rhamnose operon regulatory protein RhaS
LRRPTATYRQADEIYHADTCDPLIAAASAGQVRLGGVRHGSYPGVALPGRLLPQVRSAGYWDAHKKQSWGLDWHRNEGIELTWLQRGRLAFSVEDQRFDLRPGDLTITRPWQPHRVGDPHVQSSRLIWVILDVGVRQPHQRWTWPDWLILTTAQQRRLTMLLSHNEQPVWCADAEIGGCFEKIAAIVDYAADEFDRTAFVLYINALLLATLRLLEGQRIVLDQSLTHSQRSVEIFLRDLPARAAEPWTVSSMARQCGLQRSRFTTYCQRVTNMSPIDYLNRCRVENAQRLLEQTHLSVTQITQRCGFSTSQYFATVFRRHTGASPSRYRKNMNTTNRSR